MILADENIESAIIAGLRAAGHKVESVAESMPGTTDDEVLVRAAETRATLLTSDKDFGELVFRSGRAHAGVVLLRLPGEMSPSERADHVVRAFGAHGVDFEGRMVVITRRAIRIRGP